MLPERKRPEEEEPSWFQREEEEESHWARLPQAKRKKEEARWERGKRSTLTRPMIRSDLWVGGGRVAWVEKEANKKVEVRKDRV